MREPKETDFTVHVPDLGDFRFGRETIADRAAIRAAYLTSTIGIDADAKDNDVDLLVYGQFTAEHRQMCVSAPTGWEDVGKLIVTDKTEAQFFGLIRLVRQQQRCFRAGAAQGGQAQG